MKGGVNGTSAYDVLIDKRTAQYVGLTAAVGT